MIKAAPSREIGFSVRRQQQDIPVGDHAYPGDKATSLAETGQQFIILPGRNREEKFVILSPRQREIPQGFPIVGQCRPEGLGQRERLKLHPCSYSRTPAEMPQIGRQTIADVDHGAGKTVFCQQLPLQQTGSRSQMAHHRQTIPHPVTQKAKP
jgi:hypothetical protein